MMKKQIKDNLHQRKGNPQGKIPDKVSNKMTYEWYDEDGNKMKCQKSEYTITKIMKKKFIYV